MATIAAVMHARAALRIDVIYPPPRRTHELRSTSRVVTPVKSKDDATFHAMTGRRNGSGLGEFMNAHGQDVNDAAPASSRKLNVTVARRRTPAPRQR
jgi:hypothetical protein